MKNGPTDKRKYGRATARTDECKVEQTNGQLNIIKKAKANLLSVFTVFPEKCEISSYNSNLCSRYEGSINRSWYWNWMNIIRLPSHLYIGDGTVWQPGDGRVNALTSAIRCNGRRSICVMDCCTA